MPFLFFLGYPQISALQLLLSDHRADGSTKLLHGANDCVDCECIF